MPQVLIAYRRPTDLSEDELRSWLAGQVTGGRLVSLRLESADAQNDRGVVRVTVEAPTPPSRGQDAIAALLGDMRMLGLQPAIVSSG